MKVGPVSFPNGSEILGIVVLVIATLYMVNSVDALKKRINP